MAPLKGRGWVHSFGTSCTTISCAWTCLLKRASSASRMTQLSCALLTTEFAVGILELRINDSLWRAKRWLDSRCLKMASEKTEALLVTDRRSFKSPRIVLGEHEIKWKKSIKYLGVQLDRRLSFSEHLQIATAKAIQCGAALTRLMPNIGGPREAKRRLVASVVNSKLLYAAPIWTSALNNHAILKKLFSAQRGVVMRIVSAYRTVSTSAVLVLASVPPIDLLAEERRDLLNKPAGNRSREGGHPQGWKAQTRREMADEIAW